MDGIEIMTKAVKSADFTPKKKLGRPPGSRNKKPENGVIPTKSVCDIIEACHKNKVTDFSYNGLVISFQPDRPQSSKQKVIQEMREFPTTELEHDQLDEKFSEVSDEMELLKITEPDRYEAMLDRGEIN